MPQVTIEHPILNSASEAPARHFKFDNDGITTEIDASRRGSAFFMPLVRARPKGEQAQFDTEGTVDRIKPDTEINRQLALTIPYSFVNNHGGFGRREFIEVTDPYEAIATIRAAECEAMATAV